METVYIYDGSFNGFLCCIFDSYANQEIPAAIVSEDAFSPTFYATYAVTTDACHAKRVYRKIVKCSPDATDLIRRGFLTCMEDRELALYRVVVKLLRDGAGFLRNLADETLYPVLKAVRHLNGEVQLLRGFVRFSEFSGVLGAEIEPKNRVLPLLRSHFCGRYQNEKFFIYDRTHREALFYSTGKAIITPLQQFVMAPPDEAEADFRLLWKRFYDTIAIRERDNPRCRMTQMPKRYWNTMTEFQEDSYFIPQTYSATVPALSSPDGISAPETPSVPVLSDPG